MIEGIATATQYIIQGFSGWLSDKFQKRKSIALAGYALSAISKPFIGFAVSWPEVLSARFLDRLGSGTRSAPRDALIASSTDEKNKGKAFGLEGIGDNLGAFLGPLIAVFLLFSLRIDIRNIFYLAFIPAILAVLFILYGLYQGIFRSVGKALATDLVPIELRASGVGWYSTTIGLSGLIASIVAGVLWDKMSHPAVFIYGAIFACFGSIALLILRINALTSK